MLTEVADPQRAPEVLAIRDSIRSWRFYDHFRTDADAPARHPQIGTRTVVLSQDGRDLRRALAPSCERKAPPGLGAPRSHEAQSNALR
jgi:predicted ATPase